MFAAPVAATAILEQLFNASDIAVVGNFSGGDKTVAVAAVSANSAVIALIVNLFVGIALGANVVIANAIGKDDKKFVQKAVHTSILMSVIGGVLVAIIGEWRQVRRSDRLMCPMMFFRRRFCICVFTFWEFRLFCFIILKLQFSEASAIQKFR